MKTPNPEQAAILADITSPRRLIIADAGSGKTQTLVWQIQRDIAAGHDPAKMVCITFTNAGADEYRARLPGVQLGFMGTLHAWCLHLLNEYGSALGYQRGRVVMVDEETEVRTIKETLASIKAAPKWGVSHVREWKGSGAIGNPAAIAAKKYMQIMRKNSAADFDSVLFEAFQLIAEGYTPELSCLYVDEFQDSGRWDALIYDAIRAARYFIVGDSDQAIYGYRGGSVAHILSLATSSEWKTYHLATNHRSAPEIIAAANRLITHNSRRYTKTMQPAAGAARGEIQIWDFPTPLAEAAGIAGRLRQMAEADSLDFAAGIAVLTRYNAQIPAITAALQAEGFKVREAAKDERPWLSVAISALNALHDPENDLAAGTWLRSCYPHKGDLPGEAARHGKSAARYGMECLGLHILPPAKAIWEMFLPDEAMGPIIAAWKVDDIPGTIAALRDEHTPAPEAMAEIYVGTLHSYKGKEAGTIILAGMVQAATPGKKTGEALEEERRLFYVGITRAERLLIISSSAQYLPPFGRNLEPTEPSRFITEINRTTASE